MRRKFLCFSSSRFIWWTSLTTCGIYKKKLIILNLFSVSNKKAAFYGLINAHKVLGRVNQVLKVYTVHLLFYFKAPKLCRTIKLKYMRLFSRLFTTRHIIVPIMIQSYTAHYCTNNALVFVAVHNDFESRSDMSHDFPSFNVYCSVGSHLQGGNNRLRNLLTYLSSLRILLWLHSKHWTSVFQNKWLITQEQNLVRPFWHWVMVYPTLSTLKLYKRKPLDSLLRGSNHRKVVTKVTNRGRFEVRFKRSRGPGTLRDIHSVASALCIIAHNNVNRPHRTRKFIITKTDEFTEQYQNYPRLHH